MTRSESIYFTYDGVKSYEMGITNVHVDSGLYEEDLVAGRSIVEDRIEGRAKPYFKYIEEEPLEIPVTFAFEETWDMNKIREVARWLTQKNYKELFFNEEDYKKYLCITNSPIQVVHNGLKQGYLTLTFRCDTHHAYSSYFVSPTTTILSGETIEVDNIGDLDVKPIFVISKTGAGDLAIENLTDDGRTFTINNLADGEELTIDNFNREIVSSTGLPKYDDSNKTYIKLVYGVNRLKFTGDCDFRYECRFNLL